MVLETRAETVTRSEEAGTLCGLVELSEETPELVAGSFVPFSNTPGDVFVEPVVVSALLAVTLGEGLEVSDSNDLEPPG